MSAPDKAHQTVHDTYQEAQQQQQGGGITEALKSTVGSTQARITMIPPARLPCMLRE